MERPRIELTGKIYYANDIFITHKKEAEYTDRNIKIYEELIHTGKKLSPRNIYYYACELKDHTRYIEAIYYFEKILECNEGWVEDNISACYNLAICYMCYLSLKKGLRFY